MKLVAMDPGMNRHMEELEIERYSRRQMTEDESAPFEEHLLVCDDCRRRVEENDLFVAAMRRAARQLPSQVERRRWNFRMPRLGWAAAAASIAGVVLFVSYSRRPAEEPFPITLQAMRNAPAGKMPAGRELLLVPDLAGLTPLSSYRLEIVDANGKSMFAATMTQPPVRTPKLKAGRYFVRIYSPAGELLREYGLEAVR